MFGLPNWMSRNRLVNILFDEDSKDNVYPVTTIEDINCVTSEVIDANGEVVGHYPIIDLDCLHFYTPSTTDGHAHLVIAKPLSDKQYGKLLSVLNECGIIENGIIEHQWKNHKHTAMRLPGINKRRGSRTS